MGTTITGAGAHVSVDDADAVPFWKPGTGKGYHTASSLRDYYAVTFASLSGAAFTGDIRVPDEAYGVGWNGSLEAPTKNAVYAKIASLAQADITGLTTADSPQFTAINIGHASDTTLGRTSAGVANIEGDPIATRGVSQTWTGTSTYYRNDTGNGVAVTIEQDGTGDAAIQWILTATRAWILGIDNSDSDKFKISPANDGFASAVISIETSGNTTFGGTVSVPLGSAAAPALAFSGDSNTGMYSPGSDQLAFSTNGAARVILNTDALYSTNVKFRTPDGDASAPAWSFSGDTNNGLYRIGADNWAASVGGAKAFEFSVARNISALPLQLKSYTVATLPAGAAGDSAFATDLRVFNGAGTQEGAGVGTGGIVHHNGTAWKIAGTNVTAVA